MSMLDTATIFYFRVTADIRLNAFLRKKGTVRHGTYIARAFKLYDVRIVYPFSVF
jgi:hypothetical protein